MSMTRVHRKIRNNGNGRFQENVFVNHKNEPRELVVRIRNWLSSEAGVKSDGPAKIWASFNDFTNDHSSTLKRDGFLKKDIEKLPTSELIEDMRDWLTRRE